MSRAGLIIGIILLKISGAALLFALFFGVLLFALTHPWWFVGIVAALFLLRLIDQTLTDFGV